MPGCAFDILGEVTKNGATLPAEKAGVANSCNSIDIKMTMNGLPIRRQ